MLFPGGPAEAGQGWQHPAYLLIKAQHVCLTHFVEGRQAHCAGSAYVDWLIIVGGVPVFVNQCVPLMMAVALAH